MHLCCKRGGHDYLNLWLTLGDSVSCSGSGYPRWHSSMRNDLKRGLDYACKWTGAGLSPPWVWDALVCCHVLSAGCNHSDGSGGSSGVFIYLNRSEGKAVSVAWGSFLHLTRCNSQHIVAMKSCWVCLPPTGGLRIYQLGGSPLTLVLWQLAMVSEPFSFWRGCTSTVGLRVEAQQVNAGEWG